MSVILKDAYRRYQITWPKDYNHFYSLLKPATFCKYFKGGMKVLTNKHCDKCLADTATHCCRVLKYSFPLHS